MPTDWRLNPILLPEGECNDKIEFCPHIIIIAREADKDSEPEYKPVLQIFCNECKKFIVVEVYVN